MQQVKSDNDFWHRVHNPDNGRAEWELIDPYFKRWYDKLIEKEQEHNSSVNYAQARLPPRAYYNKNPNSTNTVSVS